MRSSKCPDLIGAKLLISAVAGLTTTAILEILKHGGVNAFIPVVRGDAEYPGDRKEGMTGLAAGMGAGKNDLKLARAVFESVGKVVVVDDEHLLDAVTGLSGSGPAYVFYFMEALVEAAGSSV